MKAEPELVRRLGQRQAQLGWFTGVCGAVVVFMAIGFFIPLFGRVREHALRSALVNAPLIAAYVALTGRLVMRTFRRHMGSTLAWVREGRAPTEEEHAGTLALPWRAVTYDARAWAAGSLVFGALNSIVFFPGFGAVVAATTWLGGETTCALMYLATERLMRPVTARALAARPAARTVAPGVRFRLAAAWALGTGVPLLGVLVIGIVGVTTHGVGTGYLAGAVLFLAAVATAAGLLATLLAAKAIADPLTAVRRGLEQIGRGELDVEVPVDDGSEVGLLQAGFNDMAEGLRERERIRDLFGRQVGDDVARAALEGGIRLGGEEREVGALFIDIVGSTALALAVPPNEVVRILNRFFRIVVEAVETHGGFVNKFEGDAALCVFGAPVPREDPAGDALRAARELATRLTRDIGEIDFGIGISAGVAVAGNVGAERRFEYTVIGDPVNEAARLSDLAKRRPERVLASAAALGRATDGEADAWDVTNSEVLRGRNAPTQLAHPRR